MLGTILLALTSLPARAVPWGDEAELHTPYALKFTARSPKHFIQSDQLLMTKCLNK